MGDVRCEMLVCGQVGRQASGVGRLKRNSDYVLNAGRETEDAFVGGRLRATLVGASLECPASEASALGMLAMVGRQVSGAEGLKLDAGRKTKDAFVGGCSQATMVGRQASGAEGLKLNAGRKTKDAFVRTRTASEQVTPLKSDVRPIANCHARAGAITEGNDSPLPLFTTSRSIPQ